ncbi:MAG: helix-turn-helix domain-containing protein [Rikenellaceae bacterium]
MSKIKILDNSYPECPVRNILSRIGDKWSTLVIYALNEGGVVRFMELQRMIPDISQKMLTVTLRTLMEDGLVAREVYAVVPPKVEYRLTERALTLLPHISALITWAKENMNSIIETRRESVDQIA